MKHHTISYTTPEGLNKHSKIQTGLSLFKVVCMVSRVIRRQGDELLLIGVSLEAKNTWNPESVLRMCAASSLLVTVTVWDCEEVGVEDSIIQSERGDDMLAVVMFAATSVCALKHPCAEEQKFNTTTWRFIRRSHVPDFKDIWLFENVNVLEKFDF